MTSLQPRSPYTADELAQLYPRELQLQLVQVLLRHGERTPVSSRFQNTGLQPYWPYCRSAKQMTSVIMSTTDWNNWDQIKYRRRLETFGPNDLPVVATGPGGEYDAVCQPGELTDKGRETTLALGQRLRHLYVDQLGFMPRLIADSDMIYLRATPIPRALESVQQAFWGMYPPSARTADFPPPTILTRTPADENLYPNDGNCRRFAQLSRAFAQRAAERWNDTPEMHYLTKKIGKWMPDGAVAVDSHPRLSGIMDTVNSTLAHGPATRLPKEFYDPKARDIIDRIGVEEWFAGFQESREYRTLGIGPLAGDLVGRMTGHVFHRGADGLVEIGGEDGRLGRGRGGERDVKLALAGCHDTTLAGLLASLGAFEGEKWPPYTSHIALELFRKQQPESGPTTAISPTPALDQNTSKPQSWWSSLFSGSSSTTPSTTNALPPTPSTDPTLTPITTTPAAANDPLPRKTLAELSAAQRAALRGYYVRVRYNDRVMSIPGCAAAGAHLEGDASFCTLEAFKAIVDRYTPRNWHQQCASGLEKSAFEGGVEGAGF